jgi:FlaG/FlaF family flagellin (archaellin)
LLIFLSLLVAAVVVVVILVAVVVVLADIAAQELKGRVVAVQH